MDDKKQVQRMGMFLDASFHRKKDTKRSERYYISVPPELVNDARFPLQKDTPVVVRIDGNKVVVMRVAPVE
jgi:hypothetical protein